MSEVIRWKLQHVEFVRRTEPDFFVYPLLSPVERSSAHVGQLVKIVVRMAPEEGSRLRGLWVTVESRRNNPAGPRYTGRHNPHASQVAPSYESCVEFGPEHIYRIDLGSPAG